MAVEKALTIDNGNALVSQVNDADTLRVGAGIQSNMDGLSIQPTIDGYATNGITFKQSSGVVIAQFDTATGCLGIGDNSQPTARLHFTTEASGAAGSAPIKFTSGTLLAALEDGAVEYSGAHLYVTIGEVRHQLDQQSSGSSLVGYTNGAETYNTALGVDATAGDYSVAVGCGAVSSGIAIGYAALADDATDTAVGQQTLGNMLWNGGSHTAVGYNAGRHLKGRQMDTPVTGCTLIGAEAGLNLGNGVLAGTAPNFNTVVGAGAFRSAVGAEVVVQGATVVGADAGRNSLVPLDAFGHGALYANTAGLFNCAVGSGAAATNQTGSFITAVGMNALASTTVGFNVALGSAAGYSDQLARNNLFIGLNAGWALDAATLVDTFNTFVGNDAGYGSAGLTTGYNNTFVGYRAAYQFRSAYNNVAVGMLSLYADLYGEGNTCLGVAAGYKITGNENTCVGLIAGYNTTSGDGNTCVGMGAGYNITYGWNNIALGRNAMYSTSTSVAMGGFGNIAIGSYALALQTDGNYNVAIGQNAGNAITTGYFNVCVGVNSDIGADSTHSIAIGETAEARGAQNCGQFFTGTNWVSNQCNFGGASDGSPQITVCAHLFSQWSDMRTKRDVAVITNGLAIIEALRPSSYRIVEDTTLAADADKAFQRRRRFGFLAQEVKASLEAAGVEDAHIVDDRGGESGAMWALDYSQFAAPLVAAVQELSAKVKELQAQLAALKA